MSSIPLPPRTVEGARTVQLAVSVQTFETKLFVFRNKARDGSQTRWQPEEKIVTMFLLPVLRLQQVRISPEPCQPASDHIELRDLGRRSSGNQCQSAGDLSRRSPMNQCQLQSAGDLNTRSPINQSQSTHLISQEKQRQPTDRQWMVACLRKSSSDEYHTQI